MNIDYYELYANEQDAKYHKHKLATIIVFDDDECVVKWAGNIGSIVVHKSLDNFKKVSLTGERMLSRYKTKQCHK